MRKSKLLIGLAVAATLALTACQGARGSAQETKAETEAAAESSAEETAAESEAEAEEKAADAEKAENGEAVVIRLGVPKAPPTLPLLHMADAGLLGDNVKIELDIWDAPEQLIAMVQDGEHDMFAFPLTVAAKLYNKGLPVQYLGCNLLYHDGFQADGMVPVKGQDRVRSASVFPARCPDPVFLK